MKPNTLWTIPVAMMLVAGILALSQHDRPATQAATPPKSARDIAPYDGNTTLVGLCLSGECEYSVWAIPQSLGPSECQTLASNAPLYGQFVWFCAHNDPAYPTIAADETGFPNGDAP